MSFTLMIDELHSRLRERGWTDVRRSFGFVLLAVRDKTTTSTELAAVLGVTKQATSKLLDAMEHAGFVERATATHDARVRTVELADRGRRLLDAVEAIYVDLEAEWAGVIGARAVEQTRQNLRRVLLDAYGGTLPAVRAIGSDE